MCHEKNHPFSSCYRSLNILKESKPQSKSLTTSFFAYFGSANHKYNAQTPRYVVHVTVIIIKNYLKNLDTSLVPALVQTLVQNMMINTLLIIILHTMTVIDRAMINIIQNLLHEHITLVAHFITPTFLVVLFDIILVLVNAPLVIITFVLDVITYHIVHPLNHVLIPIEVDYTQTLTYCINS